MSTKAPAGAPLLMVSLRSEPDVVVARQRARQIARRLGFESQDQARIATAVSEIARNTVQYAGQGRIEFRLEGRTAPQLLMMRVSDGGPGIPHLETVLSGRYVSGTGMGLGVIGARRLMDHFDISAPPGGGTTVTLGKLLPRSARPLDGAALAAISQALAAEGLQNPLAEVQYQNQELLRALEEVRRRQEELVQLNRELEDTNRGVVALYAELDEKAEHLRRADEMKTRFLSNMSHEFRTPLNSVLAIGRLLQQHTDGELSAEQEKQVGFILKAAQDLTELVDDLLDLAKVEAGKICVRPSEFELERLFGALRGMLRPLLVTDTVKLVFEDASAIPPFYTDEGKVSQILRNFLSNALKFTEQGEVRVSAALSAGGQRVVISVADTGIGIAPEDQARIFEEFGQVEHAMQRKVKGTGLGLALARRLAEVLGGSVTLQSAPGVGSTFSVDLPLVFADKPAPVHPTAVDPLRVPVLVLDDDPAMQHVYVRMLRETEFEVLAARTTRDAEAWLASANPRALVLDIRLFGEDTWSLLAEVRSRPATRALPILVVSSVDDERKALALGADVYAAQPVQREWLLDSLRRLVGGGRRVLIVDDDEATRYVLRGLCRHLGLDPVEVSDGTDALRYLEGAPAEAVFLDLVMPGLTGEEVLDRLRADPATAALPVVITTSKVLAPDERQALESQRAVVLSKAQLSAVDAPRVVEDALQRAAALVGTAPVASPGGR
jgi:signal transduction histidine kinase/DNA-binding response OmpR family regulator